MLLVSTLAVSAQQHHDLPGEAHIAVVDGNRIRCVNELDDLVMEELINWPAIKSSKADTVWVSDGFKVNYNGFTREAKLAFGRALAVWGSVLVIDVPIEVDATFTNLPERQLGGARAPWWSFIGGRNVAAPTALLNQLDGRDRRPNDADIEIVLSSSYEGWYFGLDGNPGEDEYDFVTVVLHEIAHGLGFSASFRKSSFSGRAEYGLGDDRVPTVFDVGIVTATLADGIRVLTDEEEYRNPSRDLYEALTGIKLYWGGLATIFANSVSGWPVLLWAPGEFNEGSSVSHLDLDAFPPGDADNLMTPLTLRGYAAPYPGPILKAMLSDMGWTVRGRSLYLTRTDRGR